MAESKTVLIVEDDEDILSFVELLLGGEGFRVRMARDGQEGLQSVSEEPPDVILLDLTLPGMEAGEFVTRVRSESGRRIPIVILSGVRDLGRRAQELGADDFLAKPFEVDELIAAVRKWTAVSNK